MLVYLENDMRKYAIVLFFVPCFLFGLGNLSAAEKPGVNEFLGVWEAFQEGDPPNKNLGEEPSKLVILRDASERIIVVLAVRYADKQIRFHYGVARFSNGELIFTDQRGLANRVSMGVDLKYGRFLSIKPDNLGAEADYGVYVKVGN